MPLLFVQLALAASLLSCAGAQEATVPTPLTEALAAHRGDVRALTGTATGLAPSDRELLLAATSEDAAPVTADGRLELLADLYALGRHAGPGGGETGFVESELVVELLVAALDDPDAAVVERAIHYLIDGARPQHLAHHGDAIRDRLADRREGDALRLLALLPLPEPERRRLLTRDDARPLDLRARLGDGEAAAELLAAWERADDYAELSSLARQLAFVGTPEAARALASRLRSPAVRSGVYTEVSVRAELIMALGRMHPDEPLLGQRVRELSALGDEQVGAESLRRYFAAVEAWALSTLGVTPEGDPPPPLLSRQKVVKRPLR